MKERYVTVLVGFGSVAVDIGDDPKVAQFIQYPTHASVLHEHPRFDWQAVVEPRSEARDRAQEEWCVPVTAASVEELPNDFAPDVAVLATRPDVRLAALQARPSLKGALIEKPVATSFAEGRALDEWCRECGLKVSINLFRRGEKTCRELGAGGLGELVGDIQTAVILYGNGLRNNGLHMIDLLRMLGGEVTAARALSPMRSSRSMVSGDAEAAVALELGTGATAFMHPLDFDRYRDIVIDIWGTKGRLEIYQEGLFRRYAPVREHRAISDHMEIAIDAAEVRATQCGTAFYEMYTNLADVLDGTAASFCPPAEALRSEAVVEAIFMSAQEGGRIVPIKEVWG